MSVYESCDTRARREKQERDNIFVYDNGENKPAPLMNNSAMVECEWFGEPIIKSGSPMKDIIKKEIERLQRVNGELEKALSEWLQGAPSEACGIAHHIRDNAESIFLLVREQSE